MNKTKKPKANKRGVTKRITPPHIVLTQLKIFTEVGTAIIMVAEVK